MCNWPGEGQHSNAVAVQRALPEVPVVSIPQVPPLSEPLTNWVALKDVADGMSQVLRVMKGEIPGDEEHLQGAKQEVQVEHLQIDQNHLWHPYTSMVKPGRVWSVRSAEGCLIQLEDGRRLVDGMASWWCAIHGYNVPELNAAAANQLGQMSHVMFGGLTHRPATLLAKQLLDCAPEGLTQVFLCDSGSVSVEVALWLGPGCMLFSYVFRCPERLGLRRVLRLTKEEVCMISLAIPFATFNLAL